MSSRRSRLSLVRRSESPKSPIGDRTRSSISELNVSVDSRCSTPLNTRKRPSTYSDDPDGSPVIPMSQDTNNIVTGVSWAWNSPKRPIKSSDTRVRPKPLADRNIISSKDPEFTRAQRKKNIEKLTGFNKFKSELKLLQESDETLEQKNSCSSLKVCPPTSPPPSPDPENMLMSISLIKPTKDDTPVEKKRQGNSSPFFKPASEIQSDSFNDSELDDLLLQATQAFEGKSGPLSNQPGKPPAPTVQPEKRRSLVKSRTADDIDALLGDSTLGDEELDFLLAEASQKLETEAYNSVATAADAVTQTSDNTSLAKRSGILTRHKSMPESPSQKVNKPGDYRLNSNKWSYKNLRHSPISVKSSNSDGSVMFIPPPKNDVITISSCDSSSTIASRVPTVSAQQPKCTKEEIEQKRQEALKRKASRLKRLMQGNHS